MEKIAKINISTGDDCGNAQVVGGKPHTLTSVTVE